MTHRLAKHSIPLFVFISWIVLLGLSASAWATVQTPAKAKAPVVQKQPLANAKVWAAQLQKKYNTIRTATFQFSQEYNNPWLKRVEKSSGKVSFKTQKMIWHYEKPADKEKFFAIVGHEMKYYSVPEKTVYVHPCFDQNTLSASVTFLWGKGNLTKEFEIQESDFVGQNKALKWIKLMPKEKATPVKEIALGMDPKTWLVSESRVIDAYNSVNHFFFSAIKINNAIADSVFQLKPPKGTKIEPMPGVVCPQKNPGKSS